MVAVGTVVAVVVAVRIGHFHSFACPGSTASTFPISTVSTVRIHPTLVIKLTPVMLIQRPEMEVISRNQFLIELHTESCAVQDCNCTHNQFGLQHHIWVNEHTHLVERTCKAY